MNDTITITGLVATDPRVLTTSERLNITSFRLASTQRKFSRADNAWVDGDTNWYTISSFRQLAVNAASSVRKGDRIVVTGRLRIRSWDTGEKTGTTIEIDADVIGHDLTWGTSTYSRSMSSSAERAAAAEAEPASDASAAESAPAEEFEQELQATSQVATPF